MMYYRDQMYSRRARIGVIAPIDDRVEYAFNKYAPDGDRKSVV